MFEPSLQASGGDWRAKLVNSEIYVLEAYLSGNPARGFTSHTLHPLAPPNQDRLWHRIVDKMATASSMLRRRHRGRQIVLAVPLSRAWVGLMRLRPSSSVPRKKIRIWRVWRPLGPCLEEIMVNDGQLLANSGPFCGVALWLVRSGDGGCHVLRERLQPLRR